MGVEIQMSGDRRSSENRGSRRYRYRCDATVRRLGLEEDTVTGTLLDVSARGCLIRIPNLSDFAIDAPVELTVSSNMVAFRALGSVRHRSRNRRVLGISFLNLSRRGEADLADLIADLESTRQSAPAAVLEI